MKICVLAPSPGYRSSAGARIRYRRIEKLLGAMGHSIRIVPIQDFHAETVLDADAYVITKCYDTRGLTLARILRARGKMVGVDLFDDLFSQVSDPRLVHYRNWLDSMGQYASFALCSTPRMRDVVEAFWPGRPAHVMNDPFGTFDIERLVTELEHKVRTALETRRLALAWFGQGDNTHFLVGLRDLTAFSGFMTALSQRFDVHLTILTNERALTREGLERLQSLPVPFTIVEWSEAAEHELLEDSIATFLPVNGQPFSAAKSLNRCVSALSYGTQVLSEGHDLYAAFDEFIYRRPAEFIADIEAGRPRLRRETIMALTSRMVEIGDPAVEAARLVAFLAGVRATHHDAQPAPQMPNLGVVHGYESTNDAHRSVQKLGHLSIVSPFGRYGPAYDVAFTADDAGRVEACISEPALRLLAQGLPARASLVAEGEDIRFRLDATDLVPDAMVTALKTSESMTFDRILATYGRVMSATLEVCEHMFPGLELLVSEVEPALQMPDPGAFRTIEAAA